MAAIRQSMMSNLINTKVQQKLQRGLSKKSNQHHKGSGEIDSNSKDDDDQNGRKTTRQDQDPFLFRTVNLTTMKREEKNRTNTKV